MALSEVEKEAKDSFMFLLRLNGDWDRDWLIDLVGKMVDDPKAAEKVYWTELHLKLVAPGRRTKLL